MRKITADFIYPIATDPLKKGVIVIDEKGKIVEVLNSRDDIAKEELEIFDGIICPGFINTHCHLELSHMKGVITEKTGMTGFIKEFLSKRNELSEENIVQAIADGEAEMIRNGIVAVGDISNNNLTFSQKSRKNIYYHTFVEVFDMVPWKAEETFNKGKLLLQELQNSRLVGSITPHAPYTVSNELLGKINETKGLISLHNQESEAENELFENKSGKFIEFFSEMGLPLEHFKENKLNSLRVVLPQLNKCSKILLVHNTFTSKEDIFWAHSFAENAETLKEIYWCTCPNANLYIENSLPDYVNFIEKNAKVTIGTDSLASNWSLSILDEIKTILQHNPSIPQPVLLRWATRNGAELLGLQNNYGTIEKGKNPGLVRIDNLADGKITAKSTAKRI